MDNALRKPVSKAPDGLLLSCMEKIQRTLNAQSMFSVMNVLERLSRQKGMKNYDAFGKILEDLSNMYQIPGNSEMKAKGYLALQALEKDLYSMSLLDRTQDLNRVTEVLHGKVGHLVPRTGGTPMNIEFYISPYQVLEAELNNGSQVCGTKTVVTVEGTDTLYKLPLSPLIIDPQAGEDSNPAFLQLTDELSMDLPAHFVLKFHQPVPMSSSSIEEIQKLTGML
nr:mediator of RNA polymerase II transcription subunit 1-like isoform X2 [Zonotrichia albicollis]